MLMTMKSKYSCSVCEMITTEVRTQCMIIEHGREKYIKVENCAVKKSDTPSASWLLMLRCAKIPPPPREEV